MAEVPGKLAPDTWEKVKARAQRILDLRGQPPYTQNSGAVLSGVGGGHKIYPFENVADEELHVLSEFVQFWLPFLIEKEKKK